MFAFLCIEIMQPISILRLNFSPPGQEKIRKFEAIIANTDMVTF